MTFYLISCDGGGIRGLLSALMLQELEKKYSVITNASGFVGTSTGGLIALGLAAGVSIDDIVTMYKTKGSEIFTPNGWLLTEKEAAAKPAPKSQEELEAFSGPGIFSCQYKNDGLIKVVQSMVQSNTLNSVTSRYVGVNSAQLCNPKTKSWGPALLSNGKGNPFASTKMLDAAVASAAAPTYFPPYEISGQGYFADGGVFANDPALSAIAELVDTGQSTLADIRLLSIGTGINQTSIANSSIGDPLKWGVTRWLWPFASNGVPATALLNLTMDATAAYEATISSKLLGAAAVRANVRLNETIPLDAWKDVGKLETIAKTYMASSEWTNVLNWVSNNWSKVSQCHTEKELSPAQ